MTTSYKELKAMILEDRKITKDVDARLKRNSEAVKSHKHVTSQLGNTVKKLEGKIGKMVEQVKKL